MVADSRAPKSRYNRVTGPKQERSEPRYLITITIVLVTDSALNGCWAFLIVSIQFNQIKSNHRLNTIQSNAI